MEPAVKEEFRKFGETVSVKGVSRILKARNTILRGLWLVAVLACFGILVWQLAKVFITFFSWPVESVYTEGKGRPTFPDVTICKLYSMGNELDQGMKFDNYMNITKNKKELCTFDYFRNVTNLTSKEDYYYVWSIIQNPSGYFSSFPPSDGELNSFSENLIISHIYYSWGWDTSHVDSSANPVWDSDYSKCYTIALNDSSSRTKVRGLSTILYIDNFPNTLADTFFPTPTQSRAVGVRVTVGSPGTRPNMKEGISVGPGTETTVRLWNTARTRVPDPYGNCTVQERVDRGDNRSAMYTKNDCYETCLQWMYIKECGCLNNLFYYTPQQADSVRSVVCGSTGASNASNFNDVKQLACLLELSVDVSECDSHCTDPCTEELYDMSVTSAPWPHVSVQLAFYNKYIADRDDIFGNEFDVYGNISNQTVDDATKIRMLQKLNHLENNFIQLNIIFDHYNPMVLKESPSMTSDKMLSLIGGALSLWLGITVMTIIEFVQFIFDVMAAMQRKKPANAKSNVPTSEKKELAFDKQGNVKDIGVCRGRQVSVSSINLVGTTHTLTPVSG